MAIYRVRTVFSGVPGTPYYSNLYFAAEGGTIAQARTAVNAFWEANKALISSNLQWIIENEVPSIDEATGDILSVAADATSYQSAGTQSSSPLPYSQQFLVRTRTGAFSGGREIRGRVFIPGPTTISASAGAVVNTAASAINTNAAALVASANAQWVVWAKTKGEYAVINSTSVWNQFAVLRSRRD